jgi:hypothetical protein
MKLQIGRSDASLCAMSVALKSRSPSPAHPSERLVELGVKPARISVQKRHPHDEGGVEAVD